MDWPVSITFLTPQSIVYLFLCIIAKGFGMPQTNVGVLLSCMRELILFQTKGADFYGDLDVGACIV